MYWEKGDKGEIALVFININVAFDALGTRFAGGGLENVVVVIVIVVIVGQLRRQSSC
jgi:hypothetical protein